MSFDPTCRAERYETSVDRLLWLRIRRPGSQGPSLFGGSESTGSGGTSAAGEAMVLHSVCCALVDEATQCCKDFSRVLLVRAAV
jgi:hypothetical protein